MTNKETIDAYNQLNISTISSKVNNDTIEITLYTNTSVEEVFLYLNKNNILKDEKIKINVELPIIIKEIDLNI